MLFFGGSLIGQNDSTLNNSNYFPQLTDSTSLLYKDVIKVLSNQRHYVYNNGQDTIFFSSIIEHGMFTFCDDVQLLDSIQVDGKGRKELVFYRYCKTQIAQHGGSYDRTGTQTKGQYEIWNLDSKTLIFSATNTYLNRYRNFNAYSNPKHQKGLDMYRYKFRINEEGVISIKYLFRTKNSPIDHAEGKYIYRKGGYQKIKE